MHMKFWEKTKLHRRFDAVYIAMCFIVHTPLGVEVGDLLFLRLWGWKWFVYISFFMEFSNNTLVRTQTREQRRKILLSTEIFPSRDEASSFGFPALQTVLSMRKYAIRAFTFLLRRDDFTRMKTLNG